MKNRSQKSEGRSQKGASVRTALHLVRRALAGVLLLFTVHCPLSIFLPSASAQGYTNIIFWTGSDIARSGVVFSPGTLALSTNTYLLYAGDGVTLGGVEIGPSASFGSTNIGQRIQLRRGAEANRTNFVFAIGEPAFTTNAHKLWIGDGATPGGLGVAMDTDVTAAVNNLTSTLTVWVNSQGFVTRITSNDVTNALGYSPLAASQIPAFGFITGADATNAFDSAGAASTASNNVMTWASAMFYPVSTNFIFAGSGIIVTNLNGWYYIAATGLTSNAVSTALGYSPLAASQIPVFGFITGADATNAFDSAGAASTASNNVMTWAAGTFYPVGSNFILAGAGIAVTNISGNYYIMATGGGGVDAPTLTGIVASILATNVFNGTNVMPGTIGIAALNATNGPAGTNFLSSAGGNLFWTTNMVVSLHPFILYCIVNTSGDGTYADFSSDGGTSNEDFSGLVSGETVGFWTDHLVDTALVDHVGVDPTDGTTPAVFFQTPTTQTSANIQLRVQQP
jgi:hypothetical protein